MEQGFFDMARVESSFPTWQKADRAWANRAAKGVGVRGGSKGTRTAYFYGSGFYPFGRTWGAKFAPTELCPLAPKTPPPCDPLLLPPEATPCPPTEPEPGGGNPNPSKSPKP